MHVRNIDYQSDNRAENYEDKYLLGDGRRICHGANMGLYAHALARSLAPGAAVV